MRLLSQEVPNRGLFVFPQFCLVIHKVIHSYPQPILDNNTYKSYNKTYKHNTANMQYQLLGLELRTIRISGTDYYEWYSSKLNMSSKIFSQERATPQVIQEEKDKFIETEIRHRNKRLPKIYLV